MKNYFVGLSLFGVYFLSFLWHLFSCAVHEKTTQISCLTFDLLEKRKCASAEI